MHSSLHQPPDDMALREVAEADGRRWNVWEVQPHLAESVLRSSFTKTGMAAHHCAWLAFESSQPQERRRLHAIPADWSELPDEELLMLCRQADVVPPRRRLIE